MTLKANSKYLLIILVPDKPVDIKVIVYGTEKALVLWHPPLEANGHLLSYTIYYRKIGSEPNTGKVLENQTHYEIFGLELNESYEFWVTASTEDGEGPASDYIIKKISSVTAPQIISYADQFTVKFKEFIELPCDAFGLPTPDFTWKVSSIDFLRILKIINLKSSSTFYPRY